MASKVLPTGPRLIVAMDAGEDGAVGAGAVVERKVQQLLGLPDGLARLNLHGAEIALGEGIEVDELLEQRLNGDLGVIERGLERLDERAFGVAGLCSLAAAAPDWKPFSGFMCGNSRTSRMEAWLVSSMTTRSIPMPMPPAGGIPYSRART